MRTNALKIYPNFDIDDGLDELLGSQVPSA